MALELVKLDRQTLPAIADAIRAKTGGTDLLLPSQMAEAIGAIKSLHIERGTWIPAEDTPAKQAVIPCPAGACAFCMTADADTTATIEVQSAVRYIQSVTANFAGGIDSTAPRAAQRIWNFSGYANGAALADNTDGVGIESNYTYCSGKYSWVAYYWEDTV